VPSAITMGLDGGGDILFKLAHRSKAVSEERPGKPGLLWLLANDAARSRNLGMLSSGNLKRARRILRKRPTGTTLSGLLRQNAEPRIANAGYSTSLQATGNCPQNAGRDSVCSGKF
jgi:hypothetical protein